MSKPHITWEWLSEQSDEYKIHIYNTQMCIKKHIMDELHRFEQAFIKTPYCLHRTFSKLEIITMYMKYRHWNKMKSYNKNKNV